MLHLITRINRPLLAVLTLATTVLAPTMALAADGATSSAKAEIVALIHANNQYAHANLKDQESTIAKDGSLQFWSSGGLIQQVGNDAPLSEYDAFSLVAKHIEVLELPGGESAVAMYYAEGSFQLKGGAAIDHYMTRVLEVYVKENGKWVVRAAHWSPIAGGSGTNQTSVD